VKAAPRSAPTFILFRKRGQHCVHNRRPS
jgi:hypothetical protein